jgi:hypothetical protein
VRYAKNCSPKDLWKTYFTSSRTVKEKIKKYGVESFEFEIRKIFKNRDDAITWETKVLTKLNVIKRSDFYNKTTNKAFTPLFGDKNPAKLEKTKTKISNTLKLTASRGENHPRKINPENYSHIGNLIKGRTNFWSKGDNNPMHREEVKEKFFKLRGNHANNKRVQTCEEKEKRRQSNIGKIRKKYTCKHCKNNFAKNTLLRWHDYNCKYKGNI